MLTYAAGASYGLFQRACVAYVAYVAYVLPYIRTDSAAALQDVRERLLRKRAER